MRPLAKYLRSIISILFLSVLIPIAVDYFKKSNPTAADYESTVGMITKLFIDFANLPGAYPTFFILGGLTIGVWVDSIARRIDGSRKRAREQFGLNLLILGAEMHQHQDGFHGAWPANVSALVPRIMSAGLSGKRFGIWVPPPSYFERGPGHVIGYFMTVGRLLADGHVAEAKSAAEEIRRTP